MRPVRVARRGATASSPVAGYLLIVREAHALLMYLRSFKAYYTDLIGANTDRGRNLSGNIVV